MKNAIGHRGVEIQEVIGSSLAAVADFRRGDFIQAVDGQAVYAQAEVFVLLEKAVLKGVAEVSVIRGDTLLNIMLPMF
jgi:S1-C subfamily serine protease